MKSKLKLKLGALALAACLSFSQLPAFADSEQKIEVNFTDVTNSVNTLMGEAKVLVSVKGANGKAIIAQMALGFDGDLKYKSTQFLKGENNPDNGSFWTAKASSDKRLMTSIVSTNGIDFEEDEELFIITFSGNAGETVTVNLADLENTYCTVDGEDRLPDAEKTITLTASEKENEGITATIRLVMDKVLDFTGMGNSEITVKITSDVNSGDTISTNIDTASVSDGGHRDAKTTTPTFVVENTVFKEDTYTVEISGIGYVTYKESGVKFNEELKLTNADFIPGDVNNDGEVNEEDKAMVEQFIANDEYSIAGDFNRDGKVNASDLEVFANNNDDDKDKDKDKDKDDDKNHGGSSGGGSGGGGSSGGGGNKLGGISGGVVTIPSITETTETTEITETTETTETFTDLASHAWAKDAIYTLKDKGIISGVSETEFAPANNIKRGDFILILTRMLGVNDAFEGNFADVPESAYYYNAIGSAKAAGIASGDGQNFMPESSITRQDLITLAYRAFLAKGYISETDDLSVLDSFRDKDNISDYAQNAMASMVKAGIIKGSDGNVNPKGNATRAEVAVMCARMVELMK